MPCLAECLDPTSRVVDSEDKRAVLMLGENHDASGELESVVYPMDVGEASRHKAKGQKLAVL
jgi:hypothetical protein